MKALKKGKRIQISIPDGDEMRRLKKIILANGRVFGKFVLLATQEKINRELIQPDRGDAE
jgi:hypothetical protein